MPRGKSSRVTRSSTRRLNKTESSARRRDKQLPTSSECSQQTDVVVLSDSEDEGCPTQFIDKKKNVYSTITEDSSLKIVDAVSEYVGAYEVTGRSEEKLGRKKFCADTTENSVLIPSSSESGLFSPESANSSILLKTGKDSALFDGVVIGKIKTKESISGEISHLKHPCFMEKETSETLIAARTHEEERAVGEEEFEPLFSYGKPWSPPPTVEEVLEPKPGSSSEDDDDELFKIGGICKKQKRKPPLKISAPAPTSETPAKRPREFETRRAEEVKRPTLPPPPNVVVSPNHTLTEEMRRRRQQREELMKKLSVETTQAMVERIEQEVAEEARANQSLPPGCLSGPADAGRAQLSEFLGAQAEKTEQVSSEKVKLRLRTEEGVEHCFKLGSKDRFQKLFCAFAEKVGESTDGFRFTFDGQYLEGSRSPSDYEMEDDDLVEVVAVKP